MIKVFLKLNELIREDNMNFKEFLRKILFEEFELIVVHVILSPFCESHLFNCESSEFCRFNNAEANFLNFLYFYM